MRGLWYLAGAAAVCSVLAVALVREALAAGAPPELGLPALPCDTCGRLVTGGAVHNHHHEPGCGIDAPGVEWCRCDTLLCPWCCPCNAALDMPTSSLGGAA